jgi:lysophospholipase L1-like esterase
MMIFFAMAGLGLLYNFGIIEPTTSVAVVGNKVDVNSDSGRMSAESAHVSTLEQEKVIIASNQNQDIDGNNQANDEEPKPVHVSLLSNIQERPIRIFCYGDSLTAGLAPPARDFFPYADTMQKSLADQAATDQKKYSFEVDHAGFPGWTASHLHKQLISEGTNNHVQQKLLLRDPDKSEASYYDIMIYLAGTNDLGREVPEKDIVTSVLRVHAWAHNVAKIPFTIALAVPPSEFQRNNPKAAARAATVNQDLQKVIRRNFPHFSVTTASTLWAPFPIPLGSGSSDTNKEWWATDGLHLSQRGYQRLGEYVGSMIYERLLKE